MSTLKRPYEIIESINNAVLGHPRANVVKSLTLELRDCLAPLGEDASQAESLREEVEDLRSQIKSLTQKEGGLHDDALKILRLLFECDKALTPQHIAGVLSFHPSVAKSHLDSLLSLKYIRMTGGRPPLPYAIAPKGRAHIMSLGA